MAPRNAGTLWYRPPEVVLALPPPGGPLHERQVRGVVGVPGLFHGVFGRGSDGALVVDAITSGGKTDAPVTQRVFWACMLGVTASMLLYGGGRATLQSLQAGTITAALPFTSIVLVSCVSLLLGMRDELRVMKAAEESELSASASAGE